MVVFSILITSIYSYAQYDSILFDGYERTYLVHLPPGYTGSTNIPLLIAMHGGFGNAFNMENQSRISDKADIENFIVVYPEGVKGGAFEISSWNAGWCCGYASSSDVDDVGFIDTLLDKLINNYSIDTNRIYATGMSNGGFMSYRLACELSDRIAAIAPVAASMSMTSCESQRPVPVISFHSYIDSSIPYEGGVGDGVSNHYNPSQSSVLNAWSILNDCKTSNDTIIHNEGYTFIKWTNCECEAEIHHYATQDGGHSWPGGNQTVIGDPVSIYISATNLMWDFFMKHSLDCNTFSAINTSANHEKTITVFPNPAKRKIKIRIFEKWDDLEISLYTIMGELVFKMQNQTEIDLNNMVNGIYLIKIEVDDKIRTNRILISK